MRDTILRNTGKKLTASFTVEAAFTFSLVLLTLGTLIGKAYRLHDTVTGTMILSEVMEEARYQKEEETEDREFEERGERRGDPRLSLGAYEISLESGVLRVKGRAAAGDWSQEMEMGVFKPGDTLRTYKALQNIGKEQG